MSAHKPGVCPRRSLRTAIHITLYAAACAASPVFAQQAPASAPDSTQLEEVIVSGFRASLEAAIDVKRNETSVVDVIKAEDIADFPDLNLAESLQRIPGVSIDRDGGEGRSITVRGLGADFTRVRLNGLEALATTGGKDSSGGANRGRGFDFQVFASDLFSSLTVRKSQSAEVEEGSLGATVDLRTARPFDYKGFTLSAAAQGNYNDLSEELDPRATFLIADQWWDGRVGALLSVAYAQRNTFEEGSSTVRWENPAVAGNTATNFQTTTVPATGSAWHPRIPRYGRLTYDQDRLGLTGAIQARPWDRTLLTLDVLYAKLDGSRKEEYLEAISFSRSGQGLPQTDVVSAVIDGNNNLITGTFNDVDVRSEQRIDELSTEFEQYSLTLEQEITDRLSLKAILGTSESFQDNPVQTTLSLERYDTDGYVYDYSGNQRLPYFNYGFDVNSPGSWAFSASTASGDASLIRMRPQSVKNTFDTIGADLKFELTDAIDLKGGVLFKQYEFESVEMRRFGPTSEPAVPLPAGVSLASVTQQVTGFGRNLGMPPGTPTSWLVPNVNAFADVLGIYCNCINQYGDFRVSILNQLGANRTTSEDDAGVYFQTDFNFMIADMPLRGNVGARYVETDLETAGYTGTTPVRFERSYSDFLPAMNLVLEPVSDVLVRLGAAKVISRPQLQFLSPGGSISTANQTLTLGNPNLDPIRATTVDAGIEWYRGQGALMSLGLFYKDIDSFIQNSDQTMPFGNTGQPVSLLPGTQSAATTYTVRQPLNTPGGTLKGLEVSVQQPFTFLPAPFDGFGGIVNYTYVKSDIVYLIPSANPQSPTAVTPPQSVVEPLVNLSPRSWNATLYFENDKFSVRVSGAHRGEYLTRVPGGSGTDVAGKFDTLNIDFAASWTLTEQFQLTLEGINLTDEFDDRWQSRARQNSESYEHSGRQYFLGFRYKL